MRRPGVDPKPQGRGRFAFRPDGNDHQIRSGNGAGRKFGEVVIAGEWYAPPGCRELRIEGEVLEKRFINGGRLPVSFDRIVQHGEGKRSCGRGKRFQACLRQVPHKSRYV